MRRSAAPSRFRAPLISKSSEPNVSSLIDGQPTKSRDNNVPNSQHQKAVMIMADVCAGRNGEAVIQHAQPPSALIQGNSAPISNTRCMAQPSVPSAKRRKFAVPRHTGPDTLVGIAAKQASDVVNATYYEVLWCKYNPKKKHKNWDDAVGAVRGKSVEIYDLEGKSIGKTIVKSSNLPSVGSVLTMSGKEVEFVKTMPDEQFTSGRCFIQTASAGFSTAKTQQSFEVQPFKSAVQVPNLSPCKVNIKCKAPMFDPDRPGHVVMPDPPKGYLVHSATRVKVVVDPFLGSRLRAHQVEGVKFLYSCVMGYRELTGQGAILADEMGVGKTLQCITLMWTLLKQSPSGWDKPEARRILIITPGSLVKNWQNEIKKWLGDERLRSFAVDQVNKCDVNIFRHATKSTPVMIISYEMFLRTKDVIKDIPFDLIICDEAHRLKNAKSKTFASVTSLQCQRRIALTGTPIQNDLKEFHAIIEFCNSGVLGSVNTFSRVYEDPIVKSRQPNASRKDKLLGTQRSSELSRMIELFYLRRTSSVNKAFLPPKHEYVVFVRPNQLQERMYCELTKRAIQATTTHRDGTAHLLQISNLKKLCNSPVLLCKKFTQKETESSIVADSLGLIATELSEVWSSYSESFSAHSGKFEALLGILHDMRESGVDKIVVVSNSTQCLDLIQILIEKESFKFCRLDGKTPTAARTKIVNTFNAGLLDETVFLLSSKAGGVGLNIVGANRLVLFDIDWNPANDLQSMARVWRDGQTKPVHIYRMLTAGTIEEKIYQRQIAKTGLENAILKSANDSGSNSFTIDDLRDLFTFHKHVDSQTHTLLNCGKCNRDRLDGTPSKKNSNKLASLMTWDHHASPLPNLPDGSLTKLGEIVTFVMHKEHKMELSSNEGIVDEGQNQSFDNLDSSILDLNSTSQSTR